MSTELGSGAQCVRIFFIIINLLFFALGATALGIGIYFVVETNNYGEVLTGSGFTSAGALLIIVGGVTMILTAVGLLGAFCKARPLLVIYLIAVVIIVILEIAAGIVAFVFRNDIADAIDDRMRDAVADFRVQTVTPDEFQEEVNDAVDFVQDRFDCCGADGPNDWPLLNPNYLCNNGGRAPPSCECDPTATPTLCVALSGTVNCTASGVVVLPNNPFSFVSWREGCINETRDELEDLGYIVGGIGIAFGIVQILGFFLALGLCCAITSSNKDVVV